MSLVAGGSEAGELLATSPNGVKLEQRGKTIDIPIDQIASIRFDGEPPKLASARLNYNAQAYETALENLKAVDSLAGEDLIGQDIRFYELACRARLAIAGAGDPAKAYRGMLGFVKANRKSFHFYEAVELLGDLKAATSDYAAAEKMYAQVAKSSSRRLQIRGRLLASRLSQEQAKHDEAIRRFDAVIKVASRDERYADLALQATLGKAVSLATTEKLPDALKLVHAIILKADEEDAAVNAPAYNALGRCYEAADQPTDALFAYLHTDLLYYDESTAHAAALARLAELWKTAGKPDAAQDARNRLRRDYATSIPARRAG